MRQGLTDHMQYDRTRAGTLIFSGTKIKVDSGPCRRRAEKAARSGEILLFGTVDSRLVWEADRRESISLT